MTNVEKLFWGCGAEGIAVRSMEDVILPSDKRLVLPQQTHTSNVGIVITLHDAFPDTDALISLDREIAVGVRTADCVPILLHAPDIGAVAAIHAGWKGTVGKIVLNTLEKLICLGASPGKIFAAIGPAICGECYETGMELAKIFKREGLESAIMFGAGQDPINEKVFNDSTIRIDLVGANCLLLSEAGIPDSHIIRSGICTRHSDIKGKSSKYQWPSWRREPLTTKRLITYAYLC